MARLGIVINGQMHFVSTRLGSKLQCVTKNPNGSTTYKDIGFVGYLGEDRDQSVKPKSKLKG